MPTKKMKSGSAVPEDKILSQQNSFLMKAVNLFHFIVFICYGFLSTACSAFKGYWRIIQPQKKKDITQEVILVTGGGRGLGRRIALEFAKYSPKQIILWGRHLESLSQTCAEVCALGISCVYMQCDVSNKEEIDRQANICQEIYGPVTILVNNAGVMYGGKVLELAVEDVEMSFKVNVLAHFRTIRSFLPSMQENGHGHIVTIGSCLGLMGINQTSAYSSSKHALTAFSESLSYIAESSGYTGVNTTMVYPFQINNEMFAGCISSFKI